MKKILKSLWLGLTILSTSAYASAPTPDFTIHANGKTILCPNASVGDTGIVNKITYTKIDAKEQLIIHMGAVDAAQACTSKVPNMSSWFFKEATFNKDISHWDTSSVVSMAQMFLRAVKFNQSIGDWNTSSVTNMHFMFLRAGSFNQNISTWCVTGIGSKPKGFDYASGFADNNASQPAWGTCPVSNNAPTVPVSAPTPSTPAPTPKELVETFVQRLYEHILSRLAEQAGLDYWTSDLSTGGQSAYEIVVNFFNSTEYLSRETTNGSFVEDVYASILDRKVDAAGYHYWVTQLKKGLTRDQLLDALLRSKEFDKLSEDYGVKTFPED